MAGKVNAQRYSQAVFQFAEEKGELDRWQSDLNEITRLSEDVNVAAVLKDYKTSSEAKAGLLSELLGDINPLALNLIKLLLTRDSLSMIGAISDEYNHLLDIHRGIERGEVITAIPLTDEDKAKLEERLSNMMNKKVFVQSKVDPSLIGGITVKIGGKLLDGSTHGRLEALKSSIQGIAR